MKLTPELVTIFEKDQATFGTRTAIHNLLYLQATQQLHELGETKVRTDEASTGGAGIRFQRSKSSRE